MIINATNENNIKSLNKKKISVGGQAVIEGVMMRSPEYISTVIRRADGSLEDETFGFIPISKKIKILGLPVVRGAVSLFETLKIGIKTLNWSADKAIEDEKIQKIKEEREKNNESSDDDEGDDTIEIDNERSFFSKMLEIFGTALTLIVALAIFMYIPYLITNQIDKIEGNQFFYNLIAGFIRITFLILYMIAISLLEDVKRLFQYHGAEHMAIYTFEKQLEMNVGNVRKQSRFHPRCGTSFILIVAIKTIIIFAIIDSIVVFYYGDYSSTITRVITHLSFVPFVAGLSFELLKLSDKYSKNIIVGQLLKPGLWLQHITTRVPNDEQLEVAIESIKLSTAYLHNDYDDNDNKEEDKKE